MNREYQQHIIVRSQDLDKLDHVNNVVYVQWVQEVAKAHWDKLAPVEMQQKYIWMVLRHEIEYQSQAMLGDELVASTWVAWSEGVKSERQVEIINKKTNKTVVKAKTLWCLLDAETKRPRKIGDDIMSVFHG